MKILAVYPGRFQPFHKGHAQVYQWLKKKFGDAVIATSDKVEAPKSPFNFAEKKRMMMLAGVPADDITQVINPYIAKEILADYDPKTTVLLFAVSQKDMEEDPRFSFKPTKSGKPGYLQPYKGNEKKLKPFGDRDAPKGYVVVTPTFTFDVLGKPATSASELRKQFVKLNYDKQKAFITDLFGKYNASIHKLMDKKIGDMVGRPKSVTKLKEEYYITEEGISKDNFEDMLRSFVEFASEQLELDTIPNIRYKTEEDDYKSFAAYNPSKNELSIYTKDRHPMDIYRSVAHELVHHKQNEENRINDTNADGETGSPIENEANVMAGIIMRNFGHTHPENFKLSYVVETNTASMGGIRGMGNVTGEVSPDGTSQYVLDNIEYTKSIQNSTSNLYADNMKNWWMDQKTKDEYKNRTTKNLKNIRTQLNEGINDPGKLKAIFLAGGPGSGKDYVMNSTLAGEGLKEINSDTAFEYLMKKHGLDMEMPDEERVERDIVRGRAKNITKEKERLALAGRLGVIINGTADDIEKIKTIKKNLEADGYETMMVFVNTSDDVSKQRNVERGKMGGRKVPDGTDKQGMPNGTEDIRSEKWKLAQKNIGEFQKIFGNDKFAVIDNSIDVRKATPEVKSKVQDNFSRVRRMAQQFVRADNKNPAAKKWIEGEQQKRNIEYQQPRTQKSLTQIRSEVPNVVHKPDNEMMTQARRLGLSYYGFGRFGRRVNGINKVLYHSKGGQLVKVQAMNEDKDPCWKGYEMVGMKKKGGRKVPNCVPANEEKSIDKEFDDYMTDTHKRDFGTTSLRKMYASMTPGQESAAQDQIKPVTFVSTALAEEKKKMKFVKKKLAKEDNNLPRSGLPQIGGLGPEITQYRPFTVTGFTGNLAGSFGLSESIVEWANNPETQKKFFEKYGKMAEQKLNEAAVRLEQCGCGMEMPKAKKSIAKIKETWPAAPYKSTHGDMGTVPSTGKEELNERGADSKGLYRPTEKGAGLTRKGAKHFGIKTAVTTPPSKLDPKGKAAKRRKSFCARMGGMKGPMKDEKGRPTRKAMSLRRWNCEE